MSTVHEDAANNALREFLSTEEGAKAFSIYTSGLRTNRWSIDYVNAVGQTHRHQPEQWPLEQVYSFMMVHSLIMDGDIGKVQISTNGEPCADRERAANQAGLDDLPEPFTAWVDPKQNSDDLGDGWLEWHEPIKVEQSVGYAHIDLATGRSAPVILVKTLPPTRVPLEIGYTLPSKTHEHLLRFKGVARWAYGTDRIWLFARTRPRKSLL